MERVTKRISLGAECYSSPWKATTLFYWYDQKVAIFFLVPDCEHIALLWWSRQKRRHSVELLYFHKIVICSDWKV